MNKLQYLFIHCSATPEGDPRWNAERLRKLHTDPVSQGGRGWSRPGYRTVVEYDGKARRLRDANNDAWVQPDEVTWGVGPEFNHISHHVCYVGGTDTRGRAKDTRTVEQKKALLDIVKFYITIAPDIKIIGHNQVSNKSCPSFFVPHWLEEEGIAEKNIDHRDPFGYGKIFKKQ